MATRRVLGVLEGGLGDETMAGDLPQTNSCAVQGNMLHTGLMGLTTVASGGLMGDLRWSLSICEATTRQAKRDHGLSIG